MYPSTHLPPPLPSSRFHILLCLSRGETHGYAIKGAIANDSLGSLKITDGALYATLGKLFDEGFIEITGLAPAGKSGKERLHYGITTAGLLRLKEELKRLQHAVAIA